MAKKIKTFKFNGMSIQNGIGIPDHVSSKGGEFTDTSTKK